jgi:hypothetical protein
MDPANWNPLVQKPKFKHIACWRILRVFRGQHSLWQKMNPTPDQRLTELVDAVCEVFGVTREQIVQRSRRFDICEARHAICLASVEVLHVAHERTAAYLDHRSASAVRHSLYCGRALRYIDREWRRRYFAVVSAIDGSACICPNCGGLGITGVTQGGNPVNGQDKVAA